MKLKLYIVHRSSFSPRARQMVRDRARRECRIQKEQAPRLFKGTQAACRRGADKTAADFKIGRKGSVPTQAEIARARAKGLRRCAREKGNNRQACQIGVLAAAKEASRVSKLVKRGEV